jgi:hypothetical protein
LLGSRAHPEIDLQGSIVECSATVTKFEQLLKPAEVFSRLKSGELIEPGTILIFSGDLYHAAPTNPLPYTRDVIFMESYFRKNGPPDPDSQVNPMYVALLKFLSTDKLTERKRAKAIQDFYKCLVECERLYGSNNTTKFICWNNINIKGFLSLKDYESYKTYNYHSTI